MTEGLSRVLQALASGARDELTADKLANWGVLDRSAYQRGDLEVSDVLLEIETEFRSVGLIDAS